MHCRVKTDKTVIADLPEKVEMTDFAQLTRKQTILYRKVVSDMEQKVRQMEAEHSISQFAKKGIVLTAIMKLKQICNHPTSIWDRMSIHHQRVENFSF